MKEIILNFFSDKMDELTAFVGGDILATVFFFYLLPDFDWFHPLLKIGVALFVGIFGGIGGLLGKDIYGWIRKTIWK